jgi:hypothetical protein
MEESQKGVLRDDVEPLPNGREVPWLVGYIIDSCVP